MTAFAILGGIALVAALLVVASRNPVLSALWLALDFAAVAGIFILLGAEFVAAVQVIVYSGAIVVFVLFVIMLLNLGRLPPGPARPFQYWIGLYVALVIGIAVAFAVHATETFGARGGASPEAVREVGSTAAVGTLLYTRYVYAFELVGVLLTAAVIGAVVLARRSPAEPGGGEAP